ncbi:MAG TPA: cob(I)yrinic acid a,c-diamide adenosyltransferase [Rhizomicrobium sp.]|jgi:cob(I)alamin adenosyltransferase|nr:cob(I)yrinic acid a,c-diamide adenosyltransferase [Rhizomicrobium sp.]
MGMRPRAQDESAVAIRTLDGGLVAHLEVDARVAQRAAAPVAGDAGVIDFDNLRGIDGHGNVLLRRAAIIAAVRGLATREAWPVGAGALASAMVILNRIYTRTGDKGETALGDGTRLPKHAPRIAAYGTIDEANAAIALARLHVSGEIDAMLARIQNDLFDLGADLCVPETSRRSEGALRIVDSQVERLEREIDAMNGELAPLASFVLPGGTPAAAYLHLARTIVRRAERQIVELAGNETVGAGALEYVNRLSDHLFVVSRFVNDKGSKDVLWIPGANR